MGLCLLHSMNSVNISCYSYWARCRVKCVCKPQLLSAQICLPKPHIHLAAEFNSWIYWNENWMQCHFFYVNFQRQSSLGARVMKTYRKLFCRRLNGDNMQPWELQKFILHVTDSSLRFYPLRSLLLTLIFFVILLRLSAQSSHFLSLSPHSFYASSAFFLEDSCLKWLCSSLYTSPLLLPTPPSSPHHNQVTFYQNRWFASLPM